MGPGVVCIATNSALGDPGGICMADLDDFCAELDSDGDGIANSEEPAPVGAGAVGTSTAPRDWQAGVRARRPFARPHPRPSATAHLLSRTGGSRWFGLFLEDIGILVYQFVSPHQTHLLPHGAFLRPGVAAQTLHFTV